jgi:single-stranded-DNA-specific exonuclease
MNKDRRTQQDKIFQAAIAQAEQFKDDPVLVVSHADWNHGIVGIVAAKLLERFQKPTYVLQELGDESKGSARSFGDFSAADAIRASDDIITKGGGHKLAAGVTLPTENIAAFRQRVNEFYRTKKLFNQAQLLLPQEDVRINDLAAIDEDLLAELELLEPYGNSNPEPIIKASELRVVNVRRMGADAQHVKLESQDRVNKSLQVLAFNAPNHFFVNPGEIITVWLQPTVNEWKGRRSVEGRLLHLEIE